MRRGRHGDGLWEAFACGAARPSLPARPDSGPSNEDPSQIDLRKAALIEALLRLTARNVSASTVDLAAAALSVQVMKQRVP